MKREKWEEDFTYYYFDKNTLATASTAAAIPREIEDFCNIHDAIGYVQKLGCVGISQHRIQDEYHHLCLEALKIAVEKYGRDFPLVFRGTRSDRPLSEYLILFGSRDLEVAAWYGSIIRKHKNIRGLLAPNYAIKSVATGDYDKIDEEIIFFPTQ